MKYTYRCLLLIIMCSSVSKGQSKTALTNDNGKPETQVGNTSPGPHSITRTITQDRKGNIWLATWEGVFRHNGTFTNVTSQVSSARFFSIAEDRKGNLWFGSIGSGAYYYNGQFFQHFTTSEGLLNNDVVSIYKDKKGTIWFGVFGGVSRYDGKSFRNYIIDGDDMNEDHTGKTFQERPPYEVNAIVEDKTGKFWFATRGNTFVFDGKTWTVFRKNDGKPFTNVRYILEDRKGNIWLAGNDGLWRYDGRTFTNFIPAFAGYVYEDKKGNIWVSSESDKKEYVGNGGPKQWTLSRYTEKSLSAEHAAPEIIRANEGMVFGILEATDGTVWFGTLDGAYRYNGRTVTR